MGSPSSVTCGFLPSPPGRGKKHEQSKDDWRRHPSHTALREPRSGHHRTQEPGQYAVLCVREEEEMGTWLANVSSTLFIVNIGRKIFSHS
jgi:hypothetical protein